MEKVKIRKAVMADTRSADRPVTYELLLNDSKSHIRDVQLLGEVCSSLFRDRLQDHDFTKILAFQQFLKDFKTAQQDPDQDFTQLPWYQYHIKTERHHLKDRVPEDVNLFDVFEMVIDGVVASMARQGECKIFDMDPEILAQAFRNTQRQLLEYIEVVETIEDEVLPYQLVEVPHNEIHITL